MATEFELWTESPEWADLAAAYVAAESAEPCEFGDDECDRPTVGWVTDVATGGRRRACDYHYLTADDPGAEFGCRYDFAGSDAERDAYGEHIDDLVMEHGGRYPRRAWA